MVGYEEELGSNEFMESRLAKKKKKKKTGTSFNASSNRNSRSPKVTG